jgi:hypothetical protein
MKALILSTFFALFSLSQVSAQTSSGNAGNISSVPAPSATAPIWGKLVLSGNSVTCFYGTGATAPTTWTQIGKPTTIGFVNNPILVGMYVCSHSPTAISSGTIDNFSITPTPSYRLADTDIGSPSLMGSANLVGGIWKLSGSGADIWGTADQFNFQPWLVGNDCTVICRITSLTSGDPWQKIGIMIRDGYNSGSDYAMFCATAGEGVDFQYRTQFNNNNDVVQLVAPPAPGVVASVSIGYSPTGSTSYVLRP